MLQIEGFIAAQAIEKEAKSLTFLRKSFIAAQAIEKHLRASSRVMLPFIATRQRIESKSIRHQPERVLCRGLFSVALTLDAPFRTLWCPMNLGRWIYEISLATEVLIAMVGVIGVAVYARFARNGPRLISEIKGEE